MALQVFAATEASESGSEGSLSAICDWKRDLAEQDARVRRAEKELHSIASTAKSKRQSKAGAIGSGEPCVDHAVATADGSGESSSKADVKTPSNPTRGFVSSGSSEVRYA